MRNGIIAIGNLGVGETLDIRALVARWTRHAALHGSIAIGAGGTIENGSGASAGTVFACRTCNA